jgi:AbrB family looped-hinge helix DNA binding protein
VVILSKEANHAHRKLGQRRQVVIPKAICDELGLQEGDFVEVTSTDGKVIIKPKKLVDVDDVLTPEQKAALDASLTEGIEDMKQGWVHGPFSSVQNMLHSLHGTRASKKPKKTKAS